MQIIWKSEDVSVEFLKKRLAALGHPLALPSIRTMLAILQKKGYLERRLEGRAYVYNALIAAEEFQQGFVKDLLKRAFNGSAAGLVTALLNREIVNDKELSKIKKMIADYEGENEK